MRSGTYDYYMSEPVVKDDAKGVGPFLLAYTEMRRAGLIESLGRFYSIRVRPEMSG